MAESVLQASEDLITFEVRIDGARIPEEYFVTEIEIDLALNRIPRARVNIVDGDKSREVFEISESASLLPGSEIELRLGYQGENSVVFEGLVLRHGLEVRSMGNAALVLHCADPAIRLTTRRSSKQFSGKTDGEALSQLIRDAGLEDKVTATKMRQPYALKNDATDWDYILCRAACNGHVVQVAGGRVTIAPPEFASPIYAARYGDGVDVLALDLDGTHQIAGVETKSWDPVRQDVTRASASEPSVNAEGDLSGAALAARFSFEDATQTGFAQSDSAELQVWADAELLRARLSRIRGSVRVPGQPRLTPGSTLSLSGLGARFDGDGYVSGVRHVVSSGAWNSEVTLGLVQEQFSSAVAGGFDGAIASGRQRPPAHGLQIAKVRQIHDDPDGQFRIKVSLPLLDSEEDGFWVRMLHPYASGSAGLTFLPEVGDEVVLAFLGDDPNAAVMLGALHSSKLPQPVSPKEGNPEKTILTAGQLRLAFNDTDKVIEVETPGGQKLTLSDYDKKIVAEDSNGNSVTMAEDGVTLKSPKDITLNASGQIRLNADGGAEITSSQDVAVKGMNVSVAADAAAKVKGGSSSELSAAGQTTIKGTLVSIN